MKLTLDVKLTAAQLAEAFCELDADEQVQFFVKVARISVTCPLRGQMQWQDVGPGGGEVR